MKLNRNALFARLVTCVLTTAGANAFAAGISTNTLLVNPATTDDLARTQVQQGVTRLRKTDEAQSNEQSDVKVFPGTTKALFIEMRSSSLNGVKPLDRMQDACSAINLSQAADGSVTAAKAGPEAWVTDNKGNEYRNANQPYLIPINSNLMLFTFNYQANGGNNNTIRYGKILDANCNEVAITDGKGNKQKQVELIAKNNDDCSMQEDGGGADTRVLPDGSTRVVMWAGCNGNGQDKGWLNTVDVTCNGTTSCKIAKQFDVALAQREERSRGKCTMSSADPDTAICTWTEGNNQPQRDGSWIAAVNVAKAGTQGAAAQDRILWKKQIEGQKNVANQGNNGKAKTYSVRTKSDRVLAVDAQGNITKTDMLFVSTGDLIGNNNNNRKGGRYVDARLGVAQATKTGLTWVVPMQSVLNQMEGIDYTHLKMTAVLVQDGANAVPAITFLQGSQNGGGLYAPDLKILALDQANQKFVDYGTHSVTGASYDRHLYANYLGNNPGVQGRNFSGAQFIANPFLGQNNNTSKFLLLHALTGKDPANIAKPELKQSTYLPVTQLESTGPATASKRGLNGSGGGQFATLEGASAAGVSSSVGGVLGGGCSIATTGSGNLKMMLVLAGIALFRLRRRADEKKKV